MIRTLALALALAWLAAPAFAQHADDGADHAGHAHPAAAAPEAGAVAIDPHRTVIQVNGVVCSFCAHGLEKALSKLDVVDSSQFGNGVLVDIEEQRVTLALQPRQPVPFAEIHRRIVKAGYDPVRFHVHVEGRAEHGGGGWRLAGESPAQVFELTGSVPELEPDQPLALSARLDAKVAAGLADGQPVPVVFDALH